MAEEHGLARQGEGIMNEKVDGSNIRWADSAGVFGVKIKKTQESPALSASCFR